MLSNYRCMRGCPVAPTACMGKPVFTMDVGLLMRWSPPSFGCRTFLFGVLYVKALYVCVCDVPYLFVYIVKHKL